MSPQVSSDLKNILLNLRDRKILNEKQFIQAIENLKLSSEISEEEIAPSLDMFGLKYIDRTYQRLDQSLEALDSQIQQKAQAWERGLLSKDEAKIEISKLVSKRKEIVFIQKHLKQNIQAKISRLKNLERDTKIKLKKFVFYRDYSSDGSPRPETAVHFGDMWKKYSKGVLTESDLAQKPQLLDEIETDILSSLMIPIEEKIRVIFDLDDVIQPINRDEPSEPLIPKKTPQTHTELTQVPITNKSKTTPLSSKSAWDLVGRIVFDQNNDPVGLIRPPITVDGVNYFPIVVEEPLSITTLKERYSKILKQVDLDLRKTKTQKIGQVIANSLQIPEKYALQPSFFNEWLGKIGAEIIPVKPRLTKVRFVDIKNINQSSTDQLIVKEEDFQKISVPAWIPTQGNTIIDEIKLGSDIIGMAGSHFGTIAGIMTNTPYGQSIIIKREVPPTNLLNLYLEGLGKQNLAELRFNIAKNLGIGEGDSFTDENLWKINEKERLLISPHEIYTSYYSVLPTAAFTFSDGIKSRIGVYFHSIPETFRFLNGKPIIDQKGKTGIVYGFSVVQNQLQVLWSSKSSIDIIKEVGRKSSEQYVTRFKRRISLALGISYQESLLLSNLGRYFLNFIWMSEGQSLLEAMSMIEGRFLLHRTPFSDITEITPEGLKCISHG